MSPESERIAELEEKVLQLRAMLHAEPERDRVVQIQTGLKLTYHQALIVAALYSAGATWLTAERLEMVLPERVGADPRSLSTIGVRISQIRTILGSDAIIGRYKAGWTLGAPGVLACKRALREAEAA